MNRHTVLYIPESKANDPNLWIEVANELNILEIGHEPTDIYGAEGEIVGQIAGTHSSAQAVQYKYANKGEEPVAILILDHNEMGNLANPAFQESVVSAIETAKNTIKFEQGEPKRNAGLNGTFELVTGETLCSEHQFELRGTLAGLALPGRVTTMVIQGQSRAEAQASTIMIYPIIGHEPDGTPVTGSQAVPMRAIA